MRHRYRLALIVLTSVVGPGCGDDSADPVGPTILEPRAQPYVADVPVPADFTLDSEKSTHLYKEGRRQVTHFYMGREKPLAVKDFYRHVMPGTGWRLVDEKLANNIYSLTYKKDEERCDVRVDTVPAGWFKPGTRVQVIVRTPSLEPMP
jgi:hypothetical protein